MFDGYIYLFKNKLNNKCYIGKTTDIKRRYNNHVNGNNDSYIHRAIIKYGIENFEFKILIHIQAESLEELNIKLNTLEIYYITKYDSYNSGYNITTGGEGTPGAILSESTKIKQGLAKIGDKNPAKSETVRKKISNTLKEYYKTHKKIISEETRKKISESKLGEKNPMYGKTGKLNPSYGINWTKNISKEKLEKFKSKRSENTKGEKNPMYGKPAAMKNKHYPKLLWLDEQNNIREMCEYSKNRYHPNWKPYNKINNNNEEQDTEN